ncbi:MAG: hypothetical protein ACK4QP_11105 [Pseudorhizobium sp.]
MFYKISRTLAAPAVSLLLMAGGVLAADFANWNTDGKDGISKAEFRAEFGKNRAFDIWDADNSGTLSQVELQAGLGGDGQAFGHRYGKDWFEDWDANSDSAISEDEYYDGLYASYDADHSNVIDDAEVGYVGDDMSDGGWFDVD